MKDVKAEAGRQAVADALLHLLNSPLEATAVSGVFFPRAAPLLVAAGVELLHLLYERHLHTHIQFYYAGVRLPCCKIMRSATAPQYRGLINMLTSPVAMQNYFLNKCKQQTDEKARFLPHRAKIRTYCRRTSDECKRFS